MAYTPINWQTGDVITAEKLNKMDNGWSVEKIQLFSETVTTVSGDNGNYGTLTYDTQIDAQSIIVMFDGAPYTCNAVVNNGVTYYGEIGDSGPDFSNYPFVIESAVSASGPNGVYTETAGEHTIAVTTSAIQTSSDFATAVNSVVFSSSPTLQIIPQQTTWQQVHDAIVEGKIAYYYYGDTDAASMWFADNAEFDESDNRYRVKCNGGVMTLSSSSASGALIAD